MSGQIVAIAGHLLFALLMTVVLLRAQFDALAVVVAAAIYYTSSTNLSLLAIGGGLERIIISQQRETTERRRPGVSARLIDPPLQQDRILPVDTHAPSFVPATEWGTQREALLWAMSLYLPSGEPDPSRVNLKTDKEAPGRLRVAAPQNEGAKQWLLGKHILRRIDHGYALHLGRYPTAAQLRGLMDETP